MRYEGRRMATRARCHARVAAGLTLVVLSIGLAACSDSPPTAPVNAATLAGTYVLTQVDGENVPQLRSLSAMSGRIELSAEGGAVRHILYLYRQTGLELATTSRGRFAVEGAGLRFELHDDGAGANIAAWRPFAERSANYLTLRYAQVGLPPIVEVYVRR
jgi:hypothetical protein